MKLLYQGPNSNCVVAAAAALKLLPICGSIRVNRLRMVVTQLLVLAEPAIARDVLCVDSKWRRDGMTISCGRKGPGSFTVTLGDFENEVKPMTPWPCGSIELDPMQSNDALSSVRVGISGHWDVGEPAVAAAIIEASQGLLWEIEPVD